MLEIVGNTKEYKIYVNILVLCRIAKIIKKCSLMQQDKEGKSVAGGLCTLLISNAF